MELRGVRDTIYEDSISVSVGRFIIRTNRDKLGGRAISLSYSTQGFRRLKDSDLVDLQRGLNEYLHMLGLSRDN